MALQQQRQQQTQLDPSRPSVPSSPHPSLPQGAPSHPLPHPLRRSPPNHNNPSHTHPYYPYQPPQAPITDAGPPLLLAQAPLPPHTTTHQAPQAQQGVTLQDYQAWARLGAQSYPYALQSDIQDASAAVSNLYADSAAAMDMARRQQEEQTSRRLQADTTHRFPSTHQPQGAPPQRRTPPNPHQQAHMVRTHGNDPTLDPTTTMPRVNGNGSAEMLAAQLAAAARSGTTTTDPSLVLNPDGSPSWNSAMTHLEMQQQLDHLFRFQQAHQVVDRPQAPSRGPPHRPDSSLQQRNSHSSIGPAAAPLRPQPPPSQQQMAAHHYSLELHRQQQEQLRQRLQQQQQREETERVERERRNSEEDYMRRLAAGAYGAPLSGSPHPLPPGNTYFPQQQDGPHGHPPSRPHPSLHPAHSHTHTHMVAGLPAGMVHHQLQAHLGHPQAITVDAGYPPHLLVDAVGRDPLELGVLEAAPAMIKYESPLE